MHIDVGGYAESELRQAYRDSHLGLAKVSFDRAISTDLLLRGLVGIIKARRKLAKRVGSCVQPSLI